MRAASTRESKQEVTMLACLVVWEVRRDGSGSSDGVRDTAAVKLDLETESESYAVVRSPRL